jgi:signal transduction histidine kinase
VPPRAERALRPVFTSDMEADAGLESAAAAALAAWRHKAAEILLAATAVVHLPPVVLFVLGHGPLLGSRIRTIAGAAYLVMLASALLRRVDYRKRLWAYFIAAYVIVVLANLWDDRGPYAQIGLVAHPVLILVLCGAPAARIALIGSLATLGFSPFLRVQPAVLAMLGTDGAPAVVPQGIAWFRAAAVAAFLAAVMILLDRFHRLLLDALAAEWLAKARVQRGAAERQRLEREIAAVGDAERRRLAQELHDGVCQQVTAALLRCKALQRSLEEGDTVSGADVAPLSSLLGETIEDAHNVALGLCPLEPDPEALAPALRALARQMQEMTGVCCEFRAAGDVGVTDPGMAQHLYRIAQEALSNAVRHAHASRIAVELCGSDGELTLRVQDDGAGLPRELPADGMGLRTMTSRARILEGSLSVAPAPGGGVRVICRVPRPEAGPASREETGDRRWVPSL